MIPDHVAAFIRSSVRSIWALEAILLMRSASDRAWTAEALTFALRGALPLTENILAEFTAAHIAVRGPDGVFRYAPDAKIAALIDELARIHAEFPLAVAKAVARAPNDKIQSFIDAFRLK